MFNPVGEKRAGASTSSTFAALHRRVTGASATASVTFRAPKPPHPAIPFPAPAPLNAAHMTHDIHVIGGGLAGSEAAWQLAEAGLDVRLSEMRGSGETTPAHHTDHLAALVCSTGDATTGAVGLIH